MMNVSTRDAQGGSVVDASGEIDMQSSPKMREQLRGLVAKKPKRIVVNLAEVKYIDSSGLATLVECLQSTKKTDTQLVLIGMNDNVKDIFELSGLNRVFQIMDSEEEALSA